MVGTRHNLNGLRDLTTSLSGMVCPLWAKICYHQPINLSTKFEVSISTHYEDTKGDTKCGKWGGSG